MAQEETKELAFAKEIEYGFRYVKTNNMASYILKKIPKMQPTQYCSILYTDELYNAMKKEKREFILDRAYFDTVISEMSALGLISQQNNGRLQLNSFIGSRVLEMFDV